MKAIKRTKEVEEKSFDFERITDEGWYKVGVTGWHLLFLKDLYGTLDVAVAFREGGVMGVSHNHSWRDSDNKFVKLENFSVEI